MTHPRTTQVQPVVSNDRKAFRAEMAKLDPRVSEYGLRVIALLERVRETAQKSETAGSPREKVEALELAKWGLAQLRDCVVEEAGFELTGDDRMASKLARLEQTYRAFGYYRVAGVD